MEYAVFRGLQQAATDYMTALCAFQTAQTGARDLTAAIEKRIRGERARDAGRAAELREIIADDSRSATVKRVAQAELDELTVKSYGPTSAEQAAFDASIGEAEQALQDANALRNTTIDRLREAKNALEELGKETVYRPDGGIDIRRRWLKEERGGFTAMIHRVSGEAMV